MHSETNTYPVLSGYILVFECVDLLIYYDRPIGQAIIFCSCGFYLSSSFSSPILTGRRLDVYHTSTHDVALVQI